MKVVNAAQSILPNRMEKVLTQCKLNVKIRIIHPTIGG